MESLATATLSCVQRNSVQFSDTQRESEGDSEHSQTLKESPARFKSFGKLWKVNALPVPYYDRLQDYRPREETVLRMVKR